jgi:hypothetical protein
LKEQNEEPRATLAELEVARKTKATATIAALKEDDDAEARR